ncbi:MAG: SRPBCC domain-containing protein, partial [Zoogloea sp.]|nr:SRPBCC domain-containing protein [Zoogloea sp.]
MHEITSAIEIAATPERVWSVLLDFAAYPEWNPFIRSIEGEANEGSRLHVALQPPGGKSVRLRPTVVAVEPRRELRWLGRFLLRGLFDGEHFFRIEPLTPHRVRLTQGEHYSGLLAALLPSGLSGSSKAGFVAMNRALKARAEAGHAPNLQEAATLQEVVVPIHEAGRIEPGETPAA